MFKVGDIIKGKRGSISEYSYTNEDMIGEVVDTRRTSSEDIRVKILKQSEYHDQIGKAYWVNSSYFDLAPKSESMSLKEVKDPKSLDELKAQKDFKVGDYVRGLAEPSKYSRTSREMKKGIVERVSSSSFEDSDSIFVKILEHSNPAYVGDAFYVNPKYFEKWTPDTPKAISLKEVKKESEPKLAEPKFKIGDRVKLITAAPHFGPGGVRLGDEGEITFVKSTRIDGQVGYSVCFDKCAAWSGLESELQLVGETAKPKFPCTLPPSQGGGTVLLEGFGYKAGDKVKHRTFGLGTVKVILDGRGSESIGIEFDNKVPSGHDLRYVGAAVGIKGKEGHCWFCSASSLEKVKTTVEFKPVKTGISLKEVEPSKWEEAESVEFDDDEPEDDEIFDEPSITIEQRRRDSMAEGISLKERKSAATGVALKSKERGGIMKGFGKLFGDVQIGKDTSGRLALSPAGMAILNNEGKWVAYDGTALVDVMDIKFDIDNAFYRVPTMDIKAKDVIINQSGVPVIVVAVAADAITVINPQNGLRETIVPQTNLFNMKFYIKVISLFGDAFGKMDMKKPESLLPFMLLGETDGDDMLPLMLMMNGGFGGGDMNSMLPLLLLGKGGDKSDMLPLLLLSQGGKGDMNAMLPLLLLGDKGGKGDMMETMLLMNVLGGGKGFNLFGAKTETAAE